MQARLIAAFDVGTTTTKGVLVDAEGGVVAEGSSDYGTYQGTDGEGEGEGEGTGTVEQAPDDWWEAVRGVARRFWQAGWDPRAVAAIALAGQMQDVIVVDGDGRARGRAILYSDARAGRESDRARAALHARSVAPATTAALDGASPLAKLVWLREHDPARMAACRRVLFGAQDYILARLTGRCATDATTAATTACFDLAARGWRTDWLAALDLPGAWLPDLLPAGALAGRVSAAAAAATGFAAGTPVAVGMGDAAAATLAAGVVAPGDVYLYLGTTAWAATVVREAGPGGQGLFYLPYVGGDTLIAAAPLLNAGNAHHWIMALLGLRREHGQAGGPAYDYEGFEDLLRQTPERGAGVVFLPYLHGERCPVQERRPMGAFVRLGAASGRGHLAWAVMEGICFSLRQVLETLGATAGPLRIVGGLARGASFPRLVADVCAVEVRAPTLPAAGSARAAALSVAVTLGWFASLDEAAARWLRAAGEDAQPIVPDPARAASYATLYETYRRIYPLVSQLA